MSARQLTWLINFLRPRKLPSPPLFSLSLVLVLASPVAVNGGKSETTLQAYLHLHDDSIPKSQQLILMSPSGRSSILSELVSVVVNNEDSVLSKWC
ncbi:hypothetical protein K1719_011487 [Acacia pycnantha]|nr:hypothetical protein K1719_011487 [Acacia pycnantha]